MSSHLSRTARRSSMIAVAVILIFVAVLVLNHDRTIPGSPSDIGTVQVTTEVTAETAGPVAQLDALSVKQYDPEIAATYKESWLAEFNWLDADGNGCTADEDALIAGAVSRPQVDPYGCNILAGEWFSWYDGKTFTVEDGVFKDLIDVEHVVPRKHAWVMGLNETSQATQEAFANDPLELFPISASGNRSHSDKAADQWRPGRCDKSEPGWCDNVRTVQWSTKNSAKKFEYRVEEWCLYATKIVAVNTKYGLAVTPTEKVALVDMLSYC